MKYNGKYSLKVQLLKEMSADWDAGYVDHDGSLSSDFKKSLEDSGVNAEEYQKKIDNKNAVKSKAQQTKNRFSSLSKYNQKWDGHSKNLENIKEVKKVRTYRDLKTLLLSMTITEQEVEKANKMMRKLGWTGLFARSGFKICKFILSKFSGFELYAQVLGLVKDIGEEAISLIDISDLQDKSPKRMKSNPLSDALTLHPDYSMIIDPDLEQDIFQDMIEYLNKLDDQGKLDEEIPDSEKSFTQYTEEYIEDKVGSKETGIHGADKAGGTKKLTDIEIPKMTEDQFELWKDWLDVAQVLLKSSVEIA